MKIKGMEVFESKYEHCHECQKKRKKANFIIKLEDKYLKDKYPKLTGDIIELYWCDRKCFENWATYGYGGGNNVLFKMLRKLFPPKSRVVKESRA